MAFRLINGAIANRHRDGVSEQEMTSLLEEPDTYPRFDPSGLGGRIADLPNQCQRAWDEALALPLPDAYAGVQAVVMLGMGGSAIGGDLITDLALLEQGPPISVVRNYSLPSWIGDGTLAIVSSYSGNTEETIAMYFQAREANAKLVAVTSGGTLAEVARQDGVSPLGLERLEAFGGETFIDIPASPRPGVYRAAEDAFDAPVIVFGR